MSQVKATRLPLQIETIDTFLAYIAKVDLGDFANTVVVVDGEITGTFQDTVIVKKPAPTFQ